MVGSVRHAQRKGHNLQLINVDHKTHGEDCRFLRLENPGVS